VPPYSGDARRRVMPYMAVGPGTARQARKAEGPGKVAVTPVSRTGVTETAGWR